MIKAIYKLLGIASKKELDKMKRELNLERKKNINDIKLFRRKLRADIVAKNVEIIIKNIHEIGEGK